MRFYDKTKPLYLETDMSGIGLGAALLQTRYERTCQRDIAPDNTTLRPITFTSKSLTCAGWRYRNIKREALGILHGLERYCHYCFAREVSIITNHKPLVAIFKKCCNTVTKNAKHSPQETPILSQGSIQAWTRSLHHWLAFQTQPYVEQRHRDTGHGHKGWCNTDSYKHSRMHVNSKNTTDNGTRWHLQWLKGYVIIGWPDNRDEMSWDIRMYWMFQDDMVAIDGIIMNGRHVVIPEVLKTQVLNQLYVNHMGIEKTNSWHGNQYTGLI